MNAAAFTLPLLRSRPSMATIQLPHALGTGFDSPNRQRRISAQTITGAFLLPAIYGGCAREAFGPAGFLCPRSVNLRTIAASCRLTATLGGSNSDNGALPMLTLFAPDLPAIRAKAQACRAMAKAALFADSSLSVRLKRYNAQATKARALEEQAAYLAAVQTYPVTDLAMPAQQTRQASPATE